MKNLYQQRRWLKILAFLIPTFLFNHFSLAQKDSTVTQGVISVKVSEKLAARLEGKKFSKNLTGDLVTGIASLDNVNRQLKVQRFSRVFPHAGKNEARHRKYGLHLWYEVNMEKGSPISQALKSFGSDQEIMKAEPVYEKSINDAAKNFNAIATNHTSKLTPPILPKGSNDPMLANQWHYHNAGQTGGTAGADIRLFDAWKIETGSKNVIVAITDGGIQTDHPDLEANMWVNQMEIPGNNIDDDDNGYIDDIHGYSFVDDSGTIFPDDHGTHVAGTVAAVSNNGLGVAGIAGGSGSGDGIRLMSCAVFNDFTYGGFAQSYVYSADNGAVISQNSWGYTAPAVYEQVILDAIDYFIAEAGKDENGNQKGPMKGGVVIFSAGNANDESNYYPGFYEPVVAVAASNHQDIKTWYSNFGSWVDVTAPGGDGSEEQGVISTLANNEYGSFIGTSMACPHVSGVAGLVVSKFGGAGFNAGALRGRLIHSVNSIDAVNPEFPGKLGKGRINAAMALIENDNSPPKAINDLSVASVDIGEITLTWTSPKDESGFTSAYDIRYSTSAITTANFTSATKATNVPSPKVPGETETYTVKNLRGGILFYFAVKSADFTGNISLMSNVVKETSALSPVIVVTPVSITKNLLTAATSTESLTISNKGKGSLKFSLTLSGADENAFASAAPLSGVINPGDRQLIHVSFSADGLLAGTYEQLMTIEHNDPEQKTVSIPLTLKVANNNAPIASVMPESIDFKSVQIGTRGSRTVMISNDGSDPLIIHDVQSTHQSFSTDFSESITIASFAEAELNFWYAPKSSGFFIGEISVHTNDPKNNVFKIKVQGEGLNEPPLVASPDSFDETLEKGTKVTRKMILQNNGSQDRAYRLEVINTSLNLQETPISSTREKSMARTSDSTRSGRLMRIKEHQSRFLEKSSAEMISLLKPVDAGKHKKNNAAKTFSATEETNQYSTGFEEFNLGLVNGQHDWYSTEGWTISSDNPDKGKKHFRGTSSASGSGEAMAFSPYMLEYGEYPRYTTLSMRINVDQAKAASWEIITQDDGFIGVRIRFNEDGSMDALVIDNDYETHWRRVPGPVPSGYFDMTVEYNNWGSDTSGFPTYRLFVNNQHVFSGASIGIAIGQVVILSPMETSGPVFDMDNFNFMADEFIPAFLKISPQEGTIEARSSVEVDLEFDASSMRFGSYQTDLLIKLDDTDSLIVPVALTVTGPPSMMAEPASVYMSLDQGQTGLTEMTLVNTGGKPIQVALDTELEGLSVSPASGTIPVRGNFTFTVKFEGNPGIYTDKINIKTDMEDNTVPEIPVYIVMYDLGAIFYSPQEVRFDIQAGEISTRKIQLRNDGKNTVSFEALNWYFPPWVSVDPKKGKVGDLPLDLTLTFDARKASPGEQQFWLEFRTNDLNNPTHSTIIWLNILPDTVSATKIIREVWTGITGTSISSIPVNKTPSSTNELNVFEAPANTGNNFGSRIRGYISTPMEGYYTFWIASNDKSELWLSWDENVENKELIAAVSGYTNPGQWEKYPEQRSNEIYLVANTRYYIEALHKEGVGSDHLAVGWQMADGSLERPIPGLRLAPYGTEETNNPPQVTIITPSEGEIFSALASIEISAEAEDDESVVKVEFFNGGTKVGIDSSAPYTFKWNNVREGQYTLKAVALDNSGATDTASVNVSVTPGQSCAAAGKIQREIWTGIQGTGIEKIPVDSPPSAVTDLLMFESPSNTGDHYGARIRGYLCVPETGYYFFWIASNNNSELWLTTDIDPANKIKIASVSGSTNPRQWNKYASQQSSAIFLVAERQYYIEALHKEGVGTDHIAVGWQLPDGELERPIPGTRLSPFSNATNESPLVTITSPVNGMLYSTPASIEILADASDSDGEISNVAFYNATEKIGEDTTAPYSFTWSPVSTGNYLLTAMATDNKGASTTSETISISVNDLCMASGTITRAYWLGISGSSVSSIPVNTNPAGTEQLSIFEGPENFGPHYGTRINGYICPPATGSYTFWIASNDHSELWLSTDNIPAHKTKIAFVTGATSSRQWNKFSSQRSVSITLTKGKQYYIEALHKQGVGTDNIAVGWQLPDGALERPIPGTRLSPVPSAFLAGQRNDLTTSEPAFVENSGAQTGIYIHVYPNPVTRKTFTLSIEGLEGTEIKTGTLKLDIRNLAGLTVYSNVFSCQDNCISRIQMNEDFKSGVYVIQVTLNNRTSSKKLIIR